MDSSAAPTQTRLFSFAEIVKGGEQSVRITDDGLLYAVDYAMVMTGSNRDDAGKTLRRLSEEIFPSDKFSDRKLPGKGNAHTKLVTLQNAIELAMVLPGKVAKETRVKFTDIIRRYLAGDHSLITEIQQNAVSDSPIAQMARASIETPDHAEVVSRKRQLEREDILFDLDVAERRQRLQRTLREEYAALCPDQVMDDRARLMFKDNILNLALPSGSQSARLIENGIPVPDGDARPMTAISLAAETGKRYTTKALQRIGVIMSNLYQRKYGMKAGQHEQYTDGAVRLVRSYTRKDKDMLLEAFRRYEVEPGSN